MQSLRRIADLNDKLRQSQKMEAVGQLTGGIAHDFNNLLGGSILSLEMIRKRVALNRFAELDRYIDMAATSADRAALLTHRLLAFSRRQPLDAKPVDIGRLATAATELIRQAVGLMVQVETLMPADLWRTLCDPNQLENALLNLAINARDAMPDGGRLRIEAANAQLDEAYASRHPGVAAGEYVALLVTDTGTGMTADVAARAFEPFFTTKPSGEGTGLGLSIVYGFARQSNGHVFIESEAGRGTTIRLYLPRHAGADEAASAVAGLLPGTLESARDVVLLVDDEPVVRALTGEVLRDLDYEVIEAADGAAGLLVLRSGQRVDLLVSDIGLPGGLNGRQLADAARVYRPGLKVLFITGFAENTLFGYGTLAPDMQVLTKPFAVDNFAATVRAMMRGQPALPVANTRRAAAVRDQGPG